DPDLDHELAKVPRNLEKIVGGSDEDRVGQVERDVQIAIDELRPPLRIDELLERLYRVPIDVAEPDEVQLLQQEDGIADPGLAVARNDFPDLSTGPDAAA